MNRFLSLLAGMMLFCIFSPLVSAQGGYEVKGVVADEVGPIVAATVMEQGRRVHALGFRSRCHRGSKLYRLWFGNLCG